MSDSDTRGWFAQLLGLGKPTTPLSPDDDLARIETQSRIDKLEKEKQKLDLETELLTKQLSRSGRAMEWLKALTVPAALIAAWVTYLSATRQSDSAAENRAADRFDKALARLASEKFNDRITGIAGIRQFLQKSNSPQLQEQALQFLVNAASIETNPQIQDAIQETFTALKPGQVSQTALDNALQTAVERSRILTASIIEAWPGRVEQNKKQRLAQMPALHLRAEDISSPIPDSLIGNLSLKEYQAVLEYETGPFTNALTEERLPLKGLAKLIPRLMKLGGKHQDFSGIYCKDCDFTGIVGLDGCQFNNAHLAGADFSHVSLRGASFQDSNIDGTFFYASDLTGANLSNKAYHGYETGTPSNHGTISFRFPYLECAKLEGANLTGLVVAVLDRGLGHSSTIINIDTSSLVVWAPSVSNISIDTTTKMDAFTIVVKTVISDRYATNHPFDYDVRGLREKWPNNPLLKSFLDQEVTRRRVHDPSMPERDNYPTTVLIQRVRITSGSLYELKEWPKAALRGYVDQPNWQHVPLMAELTKYLPPVSAEGNSSPGRKFAGNPTKPCDELNHPLEENLELSGLSRGPIIDSRDTTFTLDFLDGL